jgi:hypothetical protein
MIALDDAGLCHLAIAASAVPPAERRSWLRKIAARLDPAPPLSPAAAKMREYRARKRADEAVLRVKVKLGPLEELLIDHGFLAEWDCGNPGAIRDALQTAVEVWSRYP